MMESDRLRQQFLPTFSTFTRGHVIRAFRLDVASCDCNQCENHFLIDV